MRASLRAVAATDPRCALAWWAVAMAQWQSARTESRGVRSRTTGIDKGQALGSGEPRRPRARLACSAADLDGTDEHRLLNRPRESRRGRAGSGA